MAASYDPLSEKEFNLFHQNHYPSPFELLPFLFFSELPLMSLGVSLSHFKNVSLGPNGLHLLTKLFPAVTK